MAVYDTVKDFFQAATPDKKLTNLQKLTAGAFCCYTYVHEFQAGLPHCLGISVSRTCS